MLKSFHTLGLLLPRRGPWMLMWKQGILRHPVAFGALRKSVFIDKTLRLETKHRVYDACVLAVLLYGSECWTPLRRHARKLNSFHHRCIRTILGISNQEQWAK